MSTVAAYMLVFVGASFALTAGTMLVGFPIALLLSWAPMRMRTSLAGTIAGIAGVALAVVFGWAVFRWLAGPDSFTTGPFLASIVPLMIPIKNDYQKSKQIHAVIEEAPPRVQEVLRGSSHHALQCAVTGYLLGVTMAVGWWFVGR